MKTSLCLSIAAICAFIFSGCASNTAPLYPNVKASLTPQAGKGLALLYFNAGMGPGGSAKYHVYANDKALIERFTNKTFYSYQAPPGDLRLVTTKNVPYVLVLPGLFDLIPKNQPPVRIDANQVYYFKLSVGFFRENLRQVSKEEAEKDMNDCHWLNPS
jgi:hypothetical protein